MTEIGKIRAKVEELLNRASSIGHSEYLNGGIHTCITLLDFIDSLLKESANKDLEEAAKLYVADNPFVGFSPENDFKAGAKWMKEQMMKDAVYGKVIARFPLASELLYIDAQIFVKYAQNLNEGDKVKVLIIKD